MFRLTDDEFEWIGATTSGRIQDIMKAVVPLPQLGDRGVMMMRTDSTDKAFSLIELLVTISIMSLLMALFLPALSATRRASQSARCLANADQFGKAFQTFLGENKGKFPVLLDEVKKGHWVVELNRHLGDREWYLDSGTVQDESDAPSVWVCP